MSKSDFLSFEEAKKIVRTFGFKSYSIDWRKYCKSKEYNSKIPKAPDVFYKNNGWLSWADFLGSKNIATFNRVYLNYDEARKYIHTLKLNNQKEWQLFLKSKKLPNNIPSSPERVYKNKGWISLNDWLGSNTISNHDIKKQFLSFEEARKIVRNKSLKNRTEWVKYSKTLKPKNIPSIPEKTYKDKGWISFNDWLGIDWDGEYLSFEDARTFVRNLKLKDIKDWRTYCKSGKKPFNIPVTPERVYKNKGWISTQDWLGTKIVFDGTWMEFEKARSFVRSLKLKSNTEWQNFCKTDKCPNNIPVDVRRVYKDSGFISMNDFLGTKVGFDGTWLSFEEAREYVRSLNLKSGTEWRNYYKTNTLPHNVPIDAAKIYKDKGWVSMGDWLGNNVVATQLKTYLPFKEARAFVWTLNLKSFDEYKSWWKENRPNNIPANPNNTYKNDGWLSMGDWVGTTKGWDGSYLPFETAREIVHSLKLKSLAEWLVYCNSGNKPFNIPASPEVQYKGQYISAGDWLGTGRIADQLKIEQLFLPFEEAKTFIQKLGLKSHKEWIDYCNSGNKPDNIPSSPERVYKNNGWQCLADFIGTLGTGNHLWSKNALISYLEQTKNFIHVCSVPVLLTIIESNGLYNFINKQQLKKLQESEPGSEERENVTAEIIKEITAKTDDEIEHIHTDIENELTESEEKELLNEENEKEKVCDSTEIHIKQLKELDNDVITASLDDERIQFLINDSINNLWYDTLAEKLDVTKIENLVLNKSLPNTIKDRFLSEHNEVMNMALPKGWEYPHKPLLMQKLISYKLKANKRYGNWSGAGAGKTIGAVLAGRYIGAKNVLVITFNSTIGTSDTRGWTKEIKEAFPDTQIYTKLQKNIKFKDKDHNYLILNYETFQQKGAANYAISLLERNKFDYIILDEVHSIKQRGDGDESKRREVILGLIGEVRKLNPDYYLLAMSATPVINDLTEAKSLLELITFRKLDDVNTRATISNCIELFRRLVTYGIRHKNVEDNILKDNKHTIINVNADELFGEASLVDKDDVTSKELIVLDKKLEAIVPYINTSIGRTVIYTHYVSGMEERIYKFLTNLGFKVGVYTGGTAKFSREPAISDFIAGKYDVFLGSRPIGTGVDGLQKVSDREIILSLPWTNAELYQLEKRVNRKGSNFKEMDVIIPLVSISNDKKSFNWDEDRYEKVMYKATIANAAVDGIIPEKLMPKREKLEKDANSNLDEWLKRLKENEFLTVEREELETRLYPDITDEEVRRQKIESELSEFNRLGKTMLSKNMNKKFIDNPDSWHHYHSLRKESIKDWEEIPYKKIAEKITEKNDVIIDFGCGMNEFKSCVPDNKVISFDHVAADETVIACDMRDISSYVEDKSVDVCVFSLALWGPNYEDYIREAYRVLNRKGMIYIAEPLFELGDENEIVNKLIHNGFKIVGTIDNGVKFSYISAIKI